MTIHIALLRAVNVAGHGKLAMADLRDMACALGPSDPRTVLQSGNLVFGGEAKGGRAFEDALERAIADRFELRTDVFVRTAEAWERAIAANPFADEAVQDPGRLVLMTLKDAPDARGIEDLRSAIKGPERVRADGAQLYITYPDGIGRSKLTNALVEQRLGTRSTGRNWNTVLRIAAAARGESA